MTSPAEELVRTEDCYDRFLALLGNDSELRFALLDVEDCIARIALGKDGLAFAVLANAPAYFASGTARLIH